MMSQSSYIYIRPETNDREISSLAIEVSGNKNAVVLSESHKMTVESCSQTLENGVSLFDHVALNPDEIEVTLHVSNIDHESLSRYPMQVVYSYLKKIQRSRVMVSLYTLYETYHHMLISSVTVPNEAPYNGRADITLSLVRIDYIDSSNPQFRSDQIRAKNVELNLTDDDIFEMIDEAEDGNVEFEEDIEAYCDERTPIQPDNSIPQDYEQVEQGNDISLQTTAFDDFLSSIADFSKEVMVSISTVVSKAQALYNSIQALATFRCIALQGLGAINAIFPLGNQLIGISAFYDCLGRCWRADISDASGKVLYRGCVLSSTVNGLRGLNLRYDSIDDEGEVESIPLSMKGLYTSQPWNQKYIQSNQGLLQSPVAFTPSPVSGKIACALFVTNSVEADNEYRHLLQGDSIRDMNFSLDDLDYTITT